MSELGFSRIKTLMTQKHIHESIHLGVFPTIHFILVPHYGKITDTVTENYTAITKYYTKTNVVHV